MNEESYVVTDVFDVNLVDQLVCINSASEWSSPRLNPGSSSVNHAQQSWNAVWFLVHKIFPNVCTKRKKTKILPLFLFFVKNW